MDDIRLKDLIDVHALQSIQDAFSKATGVAALAYDGSNEVTTLSNPSDFCIKLTRGTEEGRRRCAECDLRGGQTAAHTKKPTVYYCHVGLMDMAAPIMLGDRQIGTIVGGQVLPEEPDEEKFRQAAREIGVDEDNYIKALGDIKIMPKEQIEAAARLMYEIAGAMSEQGMQKLRLRSSVDELVSAYERLSERIESAEKSIGDMAKRTCELKSGFEALVSSSSRSGEEVEKTSKVVNHIKDIADQTRILGFNASIEAARSGAAGAGFSVIAQEVRRLSDNSQQYTQQIDTVLYDLKSAISMVNDGVSQIFKSIDDNAKTAEQVAADVREMEQESQNLNRLCEELKK